MKLQAFKDRLKVLLYIAKEKCFSLKGGTAINLFVRDFPRLSVDIDLTYVGRESREEAIRNAEASLSRIKAYVKKNIPKVTGQRTLRSWGAERPI